MARWEPNARERLQAAALELFDERGYDRTTVSDIAARADLTERTFFRYFTDKREVLFAGTEEFEKLIVAGVANAPKTLSPLEVVVAALAASSPFLETRRATARKRHALIAAHADLRERELIKSTRLAGTLVASLRERGVAEASATLLARTGMTLFQNAYERWIEDPKKRDLAHHLHESLAELRALTAETERAKPRRKASTSDSSGGARSSERRRRGS
ncbi:MAG TPA: TetR family transcriptional regulator [Polyangiaceae bacterium]|jgi:AcrR family transcriptional regulator|nr:TetR family transcriptional regulator [Polyangiaceae bacterium]